MCFADTGDMVDANIVDMTGCCLTVDGGNGIETIDGRCEATSVGGDGCFGHWMVGWEFKLEEVMYRKGKGMDKGDDG